MGPSILLLAIWQDRGGGQLFQKACIVEIKGYSLHTSLKKLWVLMNIDKIDLGMIKSTFCWQCYHIVYSFFKSYNMFLKRIIYMICIWYSYIWFLNCIYIWLSITNIFIYIYHIILFYICHMILWFSYDSYLIFYMGFIYQAYDIFHAFLKASSIGLEGNKNI